MIGIVDARRMTTNKILHLRAIERILNSQRFVKAYNFSSEKEKERLFIIVYNSDKRCLLAWIKTILNEKSLEELWIEAHKLKIYNYRRLSKETLKEKILKERENEKENFSSKNRISSEY